MLDTLRPSSIWFSVGASGFEPPTSWSRTRRANRAALRPEARPRNLEADQPERKPGRALAARTTGSYFQSTRSMTPDAVVRSRRYRPIAVCASIAVAVLQGGWACRQAVPAAPPPPQVTVLTIAPEPVSARFEFVGQAAASRRVEVRAQVAGVIVARPRTGRAGRGRSRQERLRRHLHPRGDSRARRPGAPGLGRARHGPERPAHDRRANRSRLRELQPVRPGGAALAAGHRDAPVARAGPRVRRAGDTLRRQPLSRYRPAQFRRPRPPAHDRDAVAPRRVPESAARVVAGPVRAPALRRPEAPERDPRAATGRPARPRGSVRLRAGGQQPGGGAGRGGDVLGARGMADRAGPQGRRSRGGGWRPESGRRAACHAAGVRPRRGLELGRERG